MVEEVSPGDVIRASTFLISSSFSSRKNGSEEHRQNSSQNPHGIGQCDANVGIDARLARKFEENVFHL